MVPTEIQAGLTITYRDDGIIQYRLADVSRATIDAWAEAVQRHVYEADASGVPLRRLQMMNDSLMPTPYALGRSSKISELAPKTQGAHAFVITNTISRTLVSAFVNRLPERHVRDNIRIFEDEEDAVTWLNKYLEAISKE